MKTNIGHLESAAGIAGLAKLILTLQHGQIPPHLHLQTVNPLLKLEETPIEIPTALRDWPQGPEPRRAAVSSFGFGGTNGHVIVEEAPPTPPRESKIERPRHILTLSARSPQALSEMAGRYAGYLEESPASLKPKAQASETTQALALASGFNRLSPRNRWPTLPIPPDRRTHFAHRLAISASRLRRRLRHCGVMWPIRRPLIVTAR